MITDKDFPNYEVDQSAYNGNKALKPSGVEFEWSPEQIVEYGKCASDPIYFINTYMKIVTIDKGVQFFNTWNFQDEMILKAVDNRFVIAKMPRQVGKTTTIAGLILWYVMFHENFQVAIAAHKAKGARSILSKIQMAFQYIPKWMQPGVDEWNKGTIKLGNGSLIDTSATSSDSIRGGSYSLVYLDEFAFVPNNLQEEFYTSTYPVLSSSKTAKILITSTPNGYNLFHKFWKDSEDGRNDYVRCDVHWSDVPGRDEAWKVETIKNTSEKQFEQEFECEFLGSSNTLISSKKLGMLTWANPITMSDDDSVRVYADPEEDHSYVVVVDTARGAERDYSAFLVFDITEYPYHVVARYRNNAISHLLYPQYVYEFAKAYNEAFVLVETNDIGQVVSDILYNDFEYENMLLTQSKGRTGQQVGGGFGGVMPTFGVRTTTPVKRIGCSNLKSLIEGDKLIPHDEQLIDELKRFIAKKNSYEAEEGCKDDLVMCAVLFAWLVHQEYFKDLSNSDIRASLTEDNRQVIDDALLPFGFIDDGREEDEEIPYSPPVRIDSFNNWFNES